MFALTGGRGRLARYLRHFGVADLECDVRVMDEIDRSISQMRPSVIFHLAAKSDVDWCEDRRNESLVKEINLRGTFNVALVAEKYKAGVVLLSSDHVFSGTRWWGNYVEKDQPNPVNFYGHSKMHAEALTVSFGNLKVVRTSYLFDNARLALKIREAEEKEIEYPDFLNRSFLHYFHLAENLMDYANRFKEMPTILHLSGSHVVSWYDFMEEVMSKEGLAYHIGPRRKEIGGQAARGYNLGLNVGLSSRLGFKQYSYLDGIELVMRERI